MAEELDGGDSVSHGSNKRKVRGSMNLSNFRRSSEACVAP